MRKIFFIILAVLFPFAFVYFVASAFAYENLPLFLKDFVDSKQGGILQLISMVIIATRMTLGSTDKKNTENTPPPPS